MKSKDIICLPNPHLRQRSKKVGLIDDDITQLIKDMESATLDWEDSRAHELGVALAAIQIDQPRRVVIIRNNFEDKSDRSFQILVNPKITKYEGSQEEDFEGCLSIKDVYGKVPRYTKVKVSALNENGEPIRITAEGFLARVIQHEIDHTNGIVFVDHIKDESDAFYTLTKDGSLKPLSYESKIKDSKMLWGADNDQN
jgi:peptide deformylase